MGLRNREFWTDLAFERGGLLGLCVLVAYAWIAPAHIVDGDNAEFATLGKIGGTAHPSGYPLYLLWLRAMQWLPGSTPAHTAALATAIIGAASVVMIHAACRAWGARALGATIAAAIFAGAPLAIRSATRAEVFALNDLAAATVLWLAARGGPLRGVWRAAMLGCVAGLGMSNHMTCTLLAPIGLLGVVRGGREAGASPVIAIGAAIAGLVIGLAPYVYLFVTPDTGLSWGTVRSFDELIGMVTRRDYGGATAFLPGANEVGALTNLAALGNTLGRTWLWAPMLIGLVTLIMRVFRSADGEPRWGWAMLGLSWLVAGPLLATRYNIQPEGLGLYVIQRFHILPAVLLAIPVAVGITTLASRVVRTAARERAACAIVATLGFGAAAGASLPAVARIQGPALEVYLRNVLDSLPQNAVLFAGQDGEYFGVNYLQLALGRRPDVTQIAWQLTPFPWYGPRLTRKGVYLPDGDGPPIERVIDYLHSTGRPVFMENTRKSGETIARYPTYPYGPLIRVLPRGAKQPPVAEVFAENKALYERFVLSYPPPGDDDEFATLVHRKYAATWKSIALALDQAGRHEDAAWAREAARVIGPASN